MSPEFGSYPAHCLAGTSESEMVDELKAGPIIEAQFIETMLLLTVNHQSQIATKANRIVRAAEGRAVMEFGSRRAQGSSGAVDGARAAFIGQTVRKALTT